MSNYDYDFIIKELTREFKWKFEGLRENTEKVQNFFHSNRKRNLEN